MNNNINDVMVHGNCMLYLHNPVKQKLSPLSNTMSVTLNTYTKSLLQFLRQYKMFYLYMLNLKIYFERKAQHCTKKYMYKFIQVVKYQGNFFFILKIQSRTSIFVEKARDKRYHCIIFKASCGFV